MNIEVTKNSKDHDSDNVFLMGKHKGFAYLGRKNKNLGLMRCPECGKENYAMSVSSGECAWCDFDVTLFKQEIINKFTS